TDENLEEYYPKFENPSTGEKYYTDPTYFWYRKNFLELYRRGNSETYNCTEGGVLFDEYLKCMTLDEFLRMI
ncbi:MAG: hypothetical protein KC684_10380, partial [Candidatus Omnitrophica bacterium]|nr:hypothetical protein [Candidatus Omnitrophota bacterium]